MSWFAFARPKTETTHLLKQNAAYSNQQPKRHVSSMYTQNLWRQEFHSCWSTGVE